jgi:hypothetical protein
MSNLWITFYNRYITFYNWYITLYNRWVDRWNRDAEEEDDVLIPTDTYNEQIEDHNLRIDQYNKE